MTACATATAASVHRRVGAEAEARGLPPRENALRIAPSNPVAATQAALPLPTQRETNLDPAAHPCPGSAIRIHRRPTAFQLPARQQRVCAHSPPSPRECGCGFQTA